jgi:hypothetical protein
MGIIVQDSFTGADGTQLTAHTGEVGATWSKFGHPTEDPDLILSAGKLVPPAGYIDLPGPRHYASGAYPSGIQVVEATVKNGAVAGGAGYFYLHVRLVDVLNSYAAAVASDGTVSLFKWVNGSSFLLASLAGAFPAGTTKRLRVEATDATKRVLLDGVEILTSTDNSIAGPGTAGLDLSAWPSAAVTWNLEVDDLLATDYLSAAASFDTSLVVTAGAAAVETQFDTSLVLTGPVSATFDTLTTVTPRPPYVLHSAAGGVSFTRAPQRPATADRPLQAQLTSAAGVRSAAPLIGRTRTLSLDWRGIGAAELAALEAFLAAVGSDVFIFAGVDGVARTVLQVGEIGTLEKSPDRLDLRLELLEILS